MHKPSDRVIKAFNVSEEMEPLSGGEGRCWRAGELVFKPCETPEFWIWMAEHLSTVQAEGFRLPLPVCASDGRWVVDGWCAQRAVEGAHPQEGRWGDVLVTCDRFHEAVKHFPRPEFMTGRGTDPWSMGDRVAWEEIEAPIPHERLTQLSEMRRPFSGRSQFIHGDFTENVLFAEGQPPAVIDISPYWRPVGFAHAIVVADAICWRNADPEVLLTHVAHIDQFPQLLIRALIYRMVTTIVVSQGERGLGGYDPGVNMAMQLVS